VIWPGSVHSRTLAGAIPGLAEDFSRGFVGTNASLNFCACCRADYFLLLKADRAKYTLAF